MIEPFSAENCQPIQTNRVRLVLIGMVLKICLHELIDLSSSDSAYAQDRFTPFGSVHWHQEPAGVF
ncbi:hypothetical protein CMK14_24395 [Candidatus Poribacteria bacterium]|nr:hypothetical protein [Candidatus Poribacteria bacterium]